MSPTDKRICVFQDYQLGKMIEGLFNPEKSEEKNNYENIFNYFKGRVFKIIENNPGEVLRNDKSSEPRKSDTRLFRYKYLSKEEQKNEETKLERYYTMYHKHFVPIFKKAIEDYDGEINEENIEDIFRNSVLIPLSKVFYTYGYSLPVHKVGELVNNNEELEDIYGNSREMFERYSNHPELIEILRYLNETSTTNKTDLSSEIKRHFTEIDSILDIFSTWYNLQEQTIKDLEAINNRIQTIQKYIFLLSKGKYVFNLKKLNNIRNNNLEFKKIVYDNYIKKCVDNSDLSEIQKEIFQELFINGGDYSNEDLIKYIQNVREIRKSEITSGKHISLENVNPTEISFEEMKYSGSTERVKIIINKIFNIGNDDEIVLENPENKKQKLNKFIKFYLKKYSKHNLDGDKVKSLILNGYKSIENIKKLPKENQREAFLNFVEEKNSEFQILISWWRYTIMYREFDGNIDEIKKADNFAYGTKDLLFQKFEENGLDTNLITNYIQNGSSWDIEKLLDLDKKRFIHGKIDINNPNKFGLGEELGLISGHTELYILENENYSTQDLTNSIFSKFGKNTEIKNIYRNYIENFIGYIINNPNEKREFYEKKIEAIAKKYNKKDFIELLGKCLDFTLKNIEITKGEISKKELIDRMEICNLLLANKCETKPDDNEFLTHLSNLGLIKYDDELGKYTHIDDENIWKIRRFIKFIIKISYDVIEMIEKSEKDRKVAKEIVKNLKIEGYEQIKLKIGPRKAYGRTMKKLVQDYDGNAGKIQDLSRLRVIYDYGIIKSMDIIAKFIKSAKDIGVKMKQINFNDNLTGNPYERAKRPTHYRDNKVKLKLESGNTIEIQFLAKDLAIYKDGIEANDLLDMLKSNDIHLSKDEALELLNIAEKHNIKLPIEILEILDFDIGNNETFISGIKISSDDFYKIWREHNDKYFKEKIQLIESLPNEIFRGRLVRKTLEELI